MLNYKQINNLTGWVIFAISTLVYILTVEQTASFWDPGEFIAVSYKLQVPHPPGAPFMLLVYRMFGFLAMGDPLQVAYWMNIGSALFSGFTILFLFWSITLFGKRMFSITEGQESKEQTIALMGAGIVGSLIYTFSDSFWFSAVEAEVYAMSSFFTAIVIWAFLKWDVITDPKEENRWMVFIAYLVGLSIGVHLLNLVTLPALALIYYFKKYPTPTLKGAIYAMFLGGVALIIINNLIIPGLPSLAGSMEIFMVNSLGLPFGSGIVVFAILFIGALAFGFRYSIQKQLVPLNTTLLSLTFILFAPCYQFFSIPYTQRCDILASLVAVKITITGNRPISGYPMGKISLSHPYRPCCRRHRFEHFNQFAFERELHNSLARGFPTRIVFTKVLLPLFGVTGY